MTHESATKTKTNLFAAGMLLAAVFNGFGQPASKAPNSGDGLWQAVEQMPAEKVRKQQAPKEFTAQAWQNTAVLTLPMPEAADGEYTAPVGDLEYVGTNASARSAFRRTVQP